MTKPNTKILTFLTYEEVFSEIEKNGLLLPISHLNDSNNMDVLINSIIRDFEPIEAISYSSFLNAIVQTCDAEESLDLGMKEIRQSHLASVWQDGILFHRDNLLYLIVQIIKQESVCGKKSITGPSNIRNVQNYYKSLLLISSKLNKVQDNPEHRILKDYFIRNYPYYYLPETTYIIYSTRFQRYWHIYKNLLSSLEGSRRDKIIDGIKEIEKLTNLSFDEYFSVLTGLFNWFINVPLKRRRSPDDDSLKNLGFNYNDLESFYIRKRLFPADDNHFINLIENFSVDFTGMRKLFLEDSRKDEVSGFYYHFQLFFDHPIYKIDEGTFCIIDLKFLFDGICSGLIWHLYRLSQSNLQATKEQYGYLLEKYFTFLMAKIFKNVQLTCQNDNQPDAVLETEDSIIVFEFTTEYCRFASLYDIESKTFLEDLYRLLFNEGEEDSLARGKKERGKFYKLNTYIEDLKFKNKRIVPILVTENYLGDFDLFNRFDNFMFRHIESKKLNNLKDAKPLIINLDDLEYYWAFCDPNNGNNFIDYVDSWNNTPKGQYHYNFCYFVSSQNNGTAKIRNTEISLIFLDF